MANIKRALLCLAFLAFALPASAQVALPRTTLLNNAQPVFCVNPSTAIPESCAGTGGGGGGGGAVYGPTAIGSAAANPPIVMGGLATESATGTIYGWLVNSSGYGTVQGAGVAGTPAGGVISIQGVSGGTPQPVTCAACALETGGNLATLVTNTSSLMKSTGGTVGLVAGSAIVGKVGIDQTTPGTTNGVQVLTGSTTAVTQATAANLNATVVGTGTFAVQDGASATGGATPASILAANSTNATNVKSSAGTLYHISVQNNSTSALAYIIFFNTSSTPTCTGTPYYGPILIPYVGSTGNNGGGVIEDIAVGLNFPTGISYCLTTAVGGTGSVAANQVTGGLGYK